VNEINFLLGIVNIFIAILMLILFYPLYKGKIRMNKFYGVRFQKSFKSDENWYKINRYGAKIFILWSIPIFILGFLAFYMPFDDYFILMIVFSFTPLIILIPFIQTYLFIKKL
jgi:uncharacterized membrane protein